MEVPKLDAAAARQRNEGAEPDGGVMEAVEVTTAFLVLVTPEGQVLASPDVGVPLNIARPASEDDIKNYCGRVHENLALMQTAQMTAQLVVSTMMQAGQQMASQRVNQELIDKINTGRVRPPG